MDMSDVFNIADSEFEIGGVLPLPEEEVQVWRIELEAMAARESRWKMILSTDETARAARFHFPRDRHRYATCRGFLRILLGAYLAMEPSQVEFSYSKKEKPALGSAHGKDDIRFNLSHSGGIALLAFTRKRDVGIDVEEIRGNFDFAAIARRFFSPQEQQDFQAIPDDQKEAAFFRCWTRKESYIKATGEGLSLPLHQFDVSLRANDSNALLATRPDSSEAQRWNIREISTGKGYAAAVCASGHGWKLKSWDGALTG